MRKSSRTSTKPVVGLNIEPGYVAAVQVSVNGRPSIERAATAVLEPGVVRDGEVVDVEGLSAALRDLFREHKLPKRVRLGVANQRIVVRTMDLPPLEDPKELETAARFSAQDHIPMPLDQAVLDHQLVGMVDTPDGRKARVVLVAARSDMIDRVLAAATAAGLRPDGIDLSAFAMIRALVADQPDDEAVLYLHVGGVTNLALAEGRRCLFTRVVPGGSELMAQELSERRGLTLEHSHGWLEHVGLEEDVTLIEGDPEIVTEARGVLIDGVRRIADEVRNSIDFYRMQEGAVSVQRAVLTGPAVSIPGLAPALSAEVGLDVSTGLVPVASPEAVGDIHVGRLVIAAGLAVEEVPEA